MGLGIDTVISIRMWETQGKGKDRKSDARVEEEQVGADQVGEAQVGAAQLGEQQAGAGQVGPDQVSAAQIVSQEPLV